MEQLIFSCRENPENTTRFSTVPFQVYDMHGKPVEHREAWDRLAHKYVSVNVHGYKSPWSSVIKASNELLMGHRSVGAKYDACVLWAWPGSWSVALGYVMATKRAKEAGERLRLMLDQLQFHAAGVDLQAHSLGARVSLVALDHHEPLVGTLALCAAAVDATALWDEFSNVPKQVKRVKVFHSKDDDVLKKAYRKVPWNWFSPALGYCGPVPPGEAHPAAHRIKVYDYTGVALGHSEYRDLPRFYQDLNA